MPAIARLMERCRARRQDLGRIAVSVGPGGYTAIRIACAVANMIAEAVGARCVGVPTALAVARGVPADLPRPLAVLLASKAGTSYATVIRRSDLASDLVEAHRSSRLVGAGQLACLGARTVVGDQFVPEQFLREAMDLGMRAARPVFDPVAVLDVAALLAEEAMPAMPIYPREPDAVTLWRVRRGVG
jgi:tRNA A37 threonylcarbamoyladenosine modification protein TsaB